MSERSNELCWYVVHTYSGYENKVKDTLERSVANNEAMQKLIFDVAIPLEEVTEVRGDKKVKTQRKIYPGYVLVHMINTSESWYVVRNTRGVTGFVGPDGKPIALTDDEVDRMLNSTATVEVTDLAIGDDVVICSGSMENQHGVVEDIDTIRGKVKVSVQMFGRATLAELDLDQVEREE